MSNNHENFYKINLLLNHLTKEIVNLFRMHWHKNFNCIWEDNKKFGKRLYEIIRLEDVSSRLTNPQKDLLNKGDSNFWDISLLCIIFSCHKFYDEKFMRHLEEIRKIRNSVSHNPRLEIDEKEYDNYYCVLKEKLEEFNTNLSETTKILNQIDSTKIISSDSKKDNLILQQSKDISLELFFKKKESANGFFKNKYFLEAIEAYDDALISCSGVPENQKAIIFCNKSICFFEIYKQTKQDEDLSSAKHNAKLAILLDPIYFKAYYRLALVYEAANKHNKAIDILNKCLILEKENNTIKEKIHQINLHLMEQKYMDYLNPDLNTRDYEEISERSQKKLKEIFGDTDRLPYDIMNLDTLKKLKKQFRSLKGKIKNESDFNFEMHLLVTEAHMYYQGSSECKQDYTKAASLYSNAAQKGNAEGIYNLAVMTIRGKGVRADTRLGVEMLEKAAKLPPFINIFGSSKENIGVKESQHYLGMLYENGVFYKKDLNKARELYELAVKNGHGYSANNLGLMYLGGLGVERDLDKAEKHFLNAASKNDPNCYANLTGLYLLKNNPFKAEETHKKSKDRNNMISIMNDERITQSINHFKKIYFETKVTDEELIKFEKEKGFYDFTNIHLKVNDQMNKNVKKQTNFMSREQRLERYFKYKLDEDKITNNILKSRLENIFESQKQITEEIILSKTPTTNKTYLRFGCVPDNFDPEKLRSEHTSYPTVSTQKLTSCVESLMQVSELLNKHTNNLKNRQSYSENENLQILSEIIFKIKYCLETESSVCGFLIEKRFLIEPLCDFIINKNLTFLNDLDIGARLLKFYTNFNDYEKNTKFLEECIDKYPKYSLFYNFLGSMHCFLQSHEKGMIVYEKGLIVDPDNTEILYNKAASCLILNKKETKNAYEIFVCKADKRHRKLPEAFYGTAAFLIGEEKESKIAEIEKYYNLGRDAEKEQLFCYLPYISSSKLTVEIFLSMKKFKINGIPDESNIHEKIFKKNPIFDYSSDLHRQELILNSRRLKKDTLEHSAYKTVIKQSNRRQKRIIQNYSNLVKNMLSDIDFTYDHIEKGKFLLVAIIEKPNLDFSSLMTVVEDEENSVERVAIYNLNKSNEELLQEFQVGTVLKIMNPYIRLALDFKPIIRIDDIDSYEIVERIDRPCNLCLNPKCTLLCGKCKSSKYCSKDCQLIDWKIYEHNIVCGKD